MSDEYGFADEHVPPAGPASGNRHPAPDGGRHASKHRGHEGRGPFAWLGRTVVRHRWKVIALWLVAAAAVIVTAPALPTTTNDSSFLPTNYESIRAMNLQAQAFPQTGTVTSDAAIIVFSRTDGGKLTAADSAKVADITKTLDARHIPNIISITAGPASANRLVQSSSVAMTNAVVNANDDRANNAVLALRADIKPLVAGTDLTEGVTGSVAEGLDSSQSGSDATQIVLFATLALILILLLIIFRSPIIAVLPLIIIGLVYQVANGLTALVNRALHLNATNDNTTLLIVVLFGIGTDYFLFLMFRYRERLRRGEDRQQAMIQSVTRVGEVIASAAGVVICAFLALLLSALSVFRSLGPTLAIAVGVAALTGLTLVPAVVSLLGPKVFWPSKAWKKEPRGAAFGALGNALGRRPALFAGAAALVLVALTLGAFGFKPTFDLGSSDIPASAESQRALVTLEKGLPAGATEPTDVLLHSSSGPLPASRLTSYGTALKALPGVGSVAVPVLSADRATADYQVQLSYGPDSVNAVNAMKNSIEPGAHAAAPPGTYALVAGETSVDADLNRADNHDYAVVFPVAAVIILLILGLLLRSLVAPWYLLASVGLGFGATLGAATLLFQTLRKEEGILFLVPVFMYLFVVALGTDYNILMIARLREEAREGKDPRQAAAAALRHTGPTIGAAGLILAGSIGSLTLAGNTELSQLGFSVSAGIALAAFVMAMFFSPSITALIGQRAWWPGRANKAPAQAPATGRQREYRRTG